MFNRFQRPQLPFWNSRLLLTILGSVSGDYSGHSWESNLSCFITHYFKADTITKQTNPFRKQWDIWLPSHDKALNYYTSQKPSSPLLTPTFLCLVFFFPIPQENVMILSAWWSIKSYLGQNSRSQVGSRTKWPPEVSSKLLYSIIH